MVSDLVLVSSVVTIMSVWVMDVNSIAEVASVMVPVVVPVMVSVVGPISAVSAVAASSTSSTSTEELTKGRCETGDREDEELDAHDNPWGERFEFRGIRTRKLHTRRVLSN